MAVVMALIPAAAALAPPAYSQEASGSPASDVRARKETPSAFPARRARLAQELLRRCVIKNTFVEPLPLVAEAEEDAGLQRCSSEPSLPQFLKEKVVLETEVRKPLKSVSFADEEASTDITGATSEASEQQEVSTDMTSTSSESSASSEQGEDVCSVPEEDDEEDDEEDKEAEKQATVQQAFHEGIMEHGLEMPECPGLARALAAGAAEHSGVPALATEQQKECADASLAQAEGLLDCLCGSAPTPPPPARLNSVARPWTPARESALFEKECFLPMDDFSSATQLVMGCVLAHLKGLPVTLHASLHYTSRGWTIHAYVRLEDTHEVPLLLSNAKAAIVGATRMQASVQLLGRSREPFKDVGSGFQARLGFMRNEAWACWDAYSSGHCSRPRCRWEHPERIDFVRVIVFRGPPPSA